MKQQARKIKFSKLGKVYHWSVENLLIRIIYILIFDCDEEFSLWDEMRAIGYAAIFSDNQKFENINQNQNN